MANFGAFWVIFFAVI